MSDLDKLKREFADLSEALIIMSSKAYDTVSAQGEVAKTCRKMLLKSVVAIKKRLVKLEKELKDGKKN